MDRDEFRGGGIVLRRKRFEDAANDYAWRTDPELSRMDAVPPLTMSFSEFLRIHESQLRRPTPGTYRFAIDTTRGEHIGNCMSYDMDVINHEAEVGIMIGDRTHWGKGYGYAALVLLVDYLFSVTSTRRLYLHTLEWNNRARRCFDKCGFVQVSTLERDSQLFVRMELTKERWKLIREDMLEKLRSIEETQATSSHLTSSTAFDVQGGPLEPYQAGGAAVGQDAHVT